MYVTIVDVIWVRIVRDRVEMQPLIGGLGPPGVTGPVGRTGGLVGRGPPGIVGPPGITTGPVGSGTPGMVGTPPPGILGSVTPPPTVVVGVGFGGLP